MKKEKYILIIIIFLCFLCLFPIISFGSNTIDIKLNVYEVTVICDEYGSFIVSEDTYKNTHSFFVGDLGNISITPISNNGYVIDSITYTPGCNANFVDGKLEVTNIQKNVTITISSIPGDIPFAGLDIVPTLNQVDKDDVEQHNYYWCFIIIALTIILYMILINKN